MVERGGPSRCEEGDGVGSGVCLDQGGVVRRARRAVVDRGGDMEVGRRGRGGLRVSECCVGDGDGDGALSLSPSQSLAPLHRVQSCFLERYGLPKRG
jgi:hypothetical protein